MLSYTWPLLVMGLAGQLNQCASQIIFPYAFSGNADEARVQLGIYGACIKIAMIMVMITQAFRYAYEPFVFGSAADKKRVWPAMTAQWPDYDKYQEKTPREIPVVLLRRR